jgi:hypothetical protein
MFLAGRANKCNYRQFNKFYIANRWWKHVCSCKSVASGVRCRGGEHHRAAGALNSGGRF